MTLIDQRNRRTRLAIQRLRECVALIDDPPPGSAQARDDARRAAEQLGHAKQSNTIDSPEQENGA